MPHLIEPLKHVRRTLNMVWNSINCITVSKNRFEQKMFLTLCPGQLAIVRQYDLRTIHATPMIVEDPNLLELGGTAAAQVCTFRAF